MGLQFDVDLPCILKVAFGLFIYGTQSLPIKRAVICLRSGGEKKKSNLPETCAMLRRKKKKKKGAKLVGFVHLHFLLPQICKFITCGVYLSFKFILQSQPIFHLLYISKFLIDITQALNS